MTQERRIFLSSLREFRPELAEFQRLCAQERASQADYDFARRRLCRLMMESRGCGDTHVLSVLLALQNALDTGAGAAMLARLTQEVLEAALHVLTFDQDAPVPDSRAMFTPSRKPCLVAADDDRIVREMMMRLFAEDTDLHLAANGTEAYALIQIQRPDFVILDDFMPKMTGMRLLEMLSASSELRHIPVLMLTGSDRARDVGKAMRAGVIDYVIKPFDPADLQRRVYERLSAASSNP